MPPKSKPVAIYNPFTAKSRADRSAQEMYPGKIGQDDQRDAARHMLASGYLARAWGPGVADLIGKAHEFKETPLRHLGALAGMAQHRYDRPIDLHNNTLGIELAQKARDMEEFERLVNEAAERARPAQTPGAPWVPSAKDAAAMRQGSAQYAGGGPVSYEHTMPDMADGGRMIGDPNSYAGGGLVKSALGALKASKKATPAVVEETIQVLPKKEAGKNLTKFVKPSAVKQRVFHGSNIPENIVEDKQFAHYGPDSSEIHWFSESPKHANEYTYKYLESEGDQGAIFPVNLQIRKPLEVPFNMNSRADKSFRDHIRGLGIYPSEIEEWAMLNDLSKPSKVWQFVNTPVFREIAKRRGYDGVKAQERDYTTWGAFEPTQIKSQFNRGTYDVQDPDPGFARGGAVAAFKDGGGADKGGGAAFGVFPQMRARRTRQDPEAAKSAPLAAARGAIAGVLGAPGDIESLVRMLPGLDESTTFLPTSEDIERRLPMRELAATPVGKAATGFGTLAGGFYTGPGSPLRAVAAVPGALRHGASEFAKASGQPTANVVKPEGGDWLKGAVQRGVSGLKKYDLPDLFPEIGTPPPNSPANEAINKWIGSNLGNYLQKQMATPSDPVRKLAEEGITHLPDLATRTAEFPTGTLRRERGRAGFPEFGMGQSELAKKWENLADESIFTHRAGDIQKSAEAAGKLDEVKAAYFDRLAEIDAKMAERLTSRGFNEDEAATMMRVMSPKQKAEMVGDDGFYAISREYERAAIESQGANAMIAKDNPWLAKLDPDAPAYHGDVYDLGFDHVVDVLGDMVATGRIRPEQLNKVSLEQAIRMTHQYDIEMAEKAAKATAAAREGLPVYKEYPEGFRWVELNRPGAFAAESEAMGHSVRGYEPPKGHPDWAEGSGGSGHSGYGHGGWDAIKSGRAKVYSLVDAKGQPHVTVEVGRQQPQRFYDLEEDVRDEITDAAYDAMLAIDDPKIWNSDGSRSYYGDQKFEEIRESMMHDWIKENAPSMPLEITQIKGKSNRAPKEEYLPFVQDFVKSGQWGGVGDLGNTGLIDTRNSLAYQNVPSELWKVQEGLGEDAPRYMTQEELRKYLPPEGYAGGGSVKTGIKEGVNLARRSLFGLKPSQEMAGRELASVQRDLDRMQAELAKAGRAAPKVEERSVTIDPGKGSAKVVDVVKKVAETPLSRREILQSVAGQALRGVLPDMGGLGALGKVTQAAESVAGPATPSALTNPYAIIMSMLKQGKSEEDIMKMFADKMPSYNEYAVEDMISNVRNPSGYLQGELPALKTPSGALREIVEFKADARDDHLNPLKLRPELRQLRSADPGAYKEMINAAKDISMLSAEEAVNIGLKPKWIEKFMRGEIDYLDLPKGYQRKIDNINAGFGNED